MFLTKKAIPRRTFLRGAGVTLALPLLESMVPAGTLLAQTPAAGTSKPRFVGGSIHMEWPRDTGSLRRKAPCRRAFPTFPKFSRT